MKIKLFVIAAAIAALMSPLVASAATVPILPAIPFSDLSSIDYSFTATPRDAKFTLIDLNSATKKITQPSTLTGGILVPYPTSHAEFIFEKNAVVEMSGLKINFNETFNYGQDQATLAAYLLRAGPRSTAFSGPGDVNMFVPSNDNFVFSGPNPTGVFSSMSSTGKVNKGTVTGNQYVMSGAVRVTAVIGRNRSSARVAVSSIRPSEGYVHTVMANYSAVGTVNPGIHVLSDSYQDFDVSGASMPGVPISNITQMAP